MSWYVLDNAIRESTLPATWKHVLTNLACNVNPPKSWQKDQPWDPSDDPDAFDVWCPVRLLCLRTSCSPKTIQRTLHALAEEGVLLLQEPSRQHRSPRWIINYPRLLELRHPGFDKEEQTFQSGHIDQSDSSQSSHNDQSDDSMVVKMTPDLSSSLSPEKRIYPRPPRPFFLLR